MRPAMTAPTAPIHPPLWRHSLPAFLLAAAVGLLVWAPRLLGLSDHLTALEKLAFDLFHLGRHPPPASRVRLIEMDQRSFEALGQDTAGQWDCGLHAQLVRKLTRDGARVIVFDVLFDQPGSPEADRDASSTARKAAVHAPVRCGRLCGQPEQT
jgi:CHASE2 domain-containing sensor protein